MSVHGNIAWKVVAVFAGPALWGAGIIRWRGGRGRFFPEGRAGGS